MEMGGGTWTGVCWVCSAFTGLRAGDGGHYRVWRGR